MFTYSIQSVLEGDAVGAGWQTIVASINIFRDYLFGLPFSRLLGFKFNRGVRGICLGFLAGAALQTIILLIRTYQTNWEKEASQAEEWIKTWGGQSEPQGCPQKYKTDSLEENERLAVKQKYKTESLEENKRPAVKQNVFAK